MWVRVCVGACVIIAKVTTVQLSALPSCECEPTAQQWREREQQEVRDKITERAGGKECESGRLNVSLSVWQGGAGRGGPRRPKRLGVLEGVCCWATRRENCCR